MLGMPKPNQPAYCFTMVTLDPNDPKKTREFYPKTYAEGVYIKELYGTTVLDHIENKTEKLHLTNEERELFRKKNQAGGLVQLDNEGHIPLENVDMETVALYFEFNDVDDLLRNNHFTDANIGRLILIRDGFDDPRVRFPSHGFIVYRYLGGDPGLLENYQRIIQQHDMDVVAEWDDFSEEIQSSVEQVDALVRDSHDHKNKDVLDQFTEDENGNLFYKGGKVTYRKNIQAFVFTNDIENAFINKGDCVFYITKERPYQNIELKTPVAAVPAVEGSLDSRYENDTSLIEAPKLRTIRVNSMARMFSGCSNLEKMQYYDTSRVTNMNYFASGCTKLRNVPGFRMEACETAEGMYLFSGITALPSFSAPELTTMNYFAKGAADLQAVGYMDIPKVTNFREVFTGCVSLKELTKLVLPSVEDMTSSFERCTSLVKIIQLSTPKTKYFTKTFYNCGNLRVVSLIDFSSATDTTDMFTHCSNLEYISIVKDSLKIDLDLSNTKICAQCIIDLARDLPEITASKTINITSTPSAGYADIEELKNALQEKGWNLVY